MKYITEYRDKELAKKLVADIAKEARADKNYRLMEFCGGHTHVISRYGLEGILPKNVRMIHGPGCPVCVMPIGRIDSAIEEGYRIFENRLDGVLKVAVAP